VLQALYPVSSAAAEQSLSLSVIHSPVSYAGISDFFRLLTNTVTVDTPGAKRPNESVICPFHTQQITATEQKNP